MFGFPVPILHWIVQYGIGVIIFALFVRVIASWIGLDERNAFIRFLARITDPFLDPVRRIVRPTMNFDISFLISSFLLYTLMYLLLQSLPSQW
jgi:uncharacterized protein YggT (Ycf19 family)